MLGNWIVRWHNVEQHFDNDEIEFGKVKRNIGRQDVDFDNWEGEYFGKWDGHFDNLGGGVI